MFSIAYSVLNSEEDSYDVVQSVMMRLYQLDPALFPCGHELSWLRTVVKNEALMYLRRKKATVPLEEAEGFPVLDQRIENFVDMDAFHRLTSQLNERQKRVVSMKILGNMTHKEIVHMLSVPVGTVQWIYATSIKKTAPHPDGSHFPNAYFCRRLWVSTGTVSPGGLRSTRRCGNQQHPRRGARDVSLVIPIPGLVSVCCCRMHSFFKFSDRIPTKCLSSRI